MIRPIAAVFVLLAQVATASAQVPATPRGSGSTATNCTPTATTSDPNSIATPGQPGEPLTDKLARSGGVLCPPTGVDPEIRAPAPDGGTAKTPVVPPPGTPGGDPGVRPK
jgi:hypothetical protein